MSAGTTFGSGLWGGGSVTPPIIVPGVPLLGLVKRAFRIAGITERPQRTPSTDQLSDGLEIYNQMIGGWNTSSFVIFSSSIDEYPLTGAKVYSIGGPGAGADFDAVRPLYIGPANIIFPGSTPVRLSCEVTMDETIWASISVQDIPGAPAYILYYDNQSPIGNIYLYPQPPSGYTLELYTWQRVPYAVNLNVLVSLPDGYEQAISYNLAARLAENFPTQQKMQSSSYATAARLMADIMVMNMQCPGLQSEAAAINQNRHGYAGSFRYGSWIAPGS